MKNTRKLIPALAMLLLSAVLMSTASFAWFSMNATVTATGMQIEAKSDQTFLLISATKTTAAEIQADALLEVEIENQAKEAYTVYPTRVKPVEDGDDPITSENITFQYAVGTDYDTGTAKGNYYDVDSNNISDYVVEYVYYLTVADNAVPASDIVVKALTITNNSDTGAGVVNVAVATEYAYKNFTGTITQEDTTVLSSGLHTDDEDDDNDGLLTDADVLAVHVYVYINGDHEKVTTANAALLGNTKVSITFGIKGATQQ